MPPIHRERSSEATDCEAEILDTHCKHSKVAWSCNVNRDEDEGNTRAGQHAELFARKKEKKKKETKRKEKKKETNWKDGGKQGDGNTTTFDQHGS